MKLWDTSFPAPEVRVAGTSVLAHSQRPPGKTKGKPLLTSELIHAPIPRTRPRFLVGKLVLPGLCLKHLLAEAEA